MRALKGAVRGWLRGTEGFTARMKFKLAQEMEGGKTRKGERRSIFFDG